jgi:hypothetical protein
VLALGLGQGRQASIDNAVGAAADYGLTADEARDIAESMRHTWRPDGRPVRGGGHRGAAPTGHGPGVLRCHRGCVMACV